MAHRLRFSVRAGYLVATAAMALLSLPRLGRAAPPPTFPTDPALSYERFGLFIGIDHYPVLKDYDLNGCVNDAVSYRDIFTGQRFNVQRSLMLTNGNATRDGIVNALHQLIEQVEIAHKKDPNKPITVVITYSGHGSIVPRIEKNSDLGPDDSCWVASDSDLEGNNVIRGEELFLIHSKLRTLNAQVIMISDSCHSGEAFRGTEKARGVKLTPKPPGPNDNAFAALSKDIPLPKSTSAFLQQPGFVWYGACSNEQKAFEAIDAKRIKHGRLSIVLGTLLLNATETSYSGLSRQIAQEFTARGWSDQTPEFHAGVGKDAEHFFVGGVTPLHGEVQEPDSAKRTVKVTLGEIHGIDTGVDFHFYANSADAIARRKEIAAGEVIAVDAASCTVQVAKDKTLPPQSAWAIPETVRMQDFSAALDDATPSPAWIKAKLMELDAGKQLRLVAMNESPNVVVHGLANDQIGLYLSSALPTDAKTRALAEPKPLRLLSPPEKGQDYGELLATNLLYLARAQRLSTLDHPSRAPLTVTAEKEKFPPLSAVVVLANKGEIPGDIPQITDGDSFKLQVHNNTTRSLHITIFSIAADGKVDVLFPQTGDDRRPVPPDGMLDIGRDGPFVATVIDPSHEFERTQLKVMATEEEVDFTPLTIAPSTGVPREVRSKGGEDPLYSLVRDAMHGGEATREGGIQRVARQSGWGTYTVVFDVKRKN